VVGGAGGGSNPAAGTAHGLLAAASYSGFLFLLRRLGATSAVRGYRDTLVAAAAVTVLVGLIGGSLTFALDWRAWLWLVLVVVVGQGPGWLLVAVGSPELRPHNAATLLLLTPIGALVLSLAVLDERPTDAQLLGCCLVLAGVLIQSAKKT
jgi:drug/metabolite transporter (DMT)-like permease